MWKSPSCCSSQFLAPPNPRPRATRLLTLPSCPAAPCWDARPSLDTPPLGTHQGSISFAQPTCVRSTWATC